MHPVCFYCANQNNESCLYAAAGAFDPADYFTDPCVGFLAPDTTIECPRYLPPFLSRDNNPIARVKIFPTTFTVPSSGIRVEFNDGDASSPVEEFPGTTNEAIGTVDDGAPTASEFTGDVGLSDANDTFNDMVVRFTDGVLAGEARVVTDYVGATRTFHFDDLAFSGTPGDGDGISIENLAVVPTIAWYAESGFALGINSDDGQYGIRYFGKFYAVESGNYEFIFVGRGECNFTINSTYYLGSGATDFEELSPKEYTIVPTAGAISLTAGQWYDFEIRYRRVDTLVPAGLCVLWRNDQTWHRPTVLSAGVCSYTGQFLTGVEVLDYDELSISRSPENADIAEVSFGVSLNTSTEGRGYYYDQATRSFKHNGAGPDLVPNRLITVETGYRTVGASDNDQYRTILTGHCLGPKTERQAKTADKVSLSVLDFGHLLHAHTENWPTPLDYFMAGLIGSDRPNGGTCPPAWDAWDLDKVFEVLLIRGGIDPVLLRTRRLYFGPAETAVEGEMKVQQAHPRVVLESKHSYGNPGVIIEPTSESEQKIDDGYFWGTQFGEEILDELNRLADNYGWRWGHHSGGDVDPGVLEFGGGPYLKAKGNALYTVFGVSDWNLVWYGAFEGDEAVCSKHLVKLDPDDEDATPKVDTTIFKEGAQSVMFGAVDESLMLGTFTFQKGQVYAITLWAYYDAGAYNTDIILRVQTPWAGFDEFHPWDETLFAAVVGGSTDIPGDDTWRRYKIIVTCPDDERLTLSAVINTALQASSNIYIDAVQMVMLRKTGSALRDFRDYENSTFIHQHPNAIRGEYLQGDVTGHGASEYVEFYMPFRGTRVDVITGPGADLAEAGDHIRMRVYRSDDDSIMQDSDGNDIDESVNQYHVAPETGRDVWLYYDGTDDTGANPCVVSLADSLPLDDYYVRVDFLKEEPRLDALLVYGEDMESPIDLPGIVDLTYRTRADAAEPFQPGTIGNLDAALLSEEQRNDVMVLGASQGLFVPDEQNPNVVVDPNNPIQQYVYARAIDRASLYKPAASNYMGRLSQTVIVEPSISSNARAKWLAESTIKQNQDPGQQGQVGAIHNPLLDPGDPIKILDEEKDSIHTDVVTVGGLASSIGRLAVDTLDMDTLDRPGSYVPRHDRDLGIFAGDFIVDFALHNHGNMLGTLKGDMAFDDLSCIVSLPASGVGSDVNSFPERGYILVETGTDRGDWEFIHYESISRDAGNHEVTLTWSNLALHRGLEYRQRQLEDDGETFINDTSATNVAHSADDVVYAGYDPYLSEESPPYRIKISGNLIQAGYLRVDLFAYFPGEATPTVHVANLTKLDTDGLESGVGERHFDPGAFVFYWDGVASKQWNEGCNLQVPENDASYGGFYAAEHRPNKEWDGPPSSAGGAFAEQIYSQFQVVFTLRTLAGDIYDQIITSDYIYTRRGPKVEGATIRHWTYGSPLPGSGATTQTWSTEDVPGTRFVDNTNESPYNTSKGLLISLQQDASSRVEGARHIRSAELEVTLFRYAEARIIDYRNLLPNQSEAYSGSKEFSWETFPLNVQTLREADDEWQFSIRPGSDHRYDGYITEIFAGNSAVDLWVEQEWVSFFGAWLLQIRPIVIDRSGRLAELDYLYVQWCGDGMRNTAGYKKPRGWGDWGGTVKLIPALRADGNDNYKEVPTGTLDEEKKWYWWVHQIYLGT